MGFELGKSMTIDFNRLLPKDFGKFMAGSIGEFIGKSFIEMNKKIGKSVKKRGKSEIKLYKKVAKSLTPVLGGMLDFIGIVLQILDAMGVLEPIMAIFNSVLQIIGGSILESLVPALEDMAEILFGEEAMANWDKLGENSADILIPVLMAIVEIIMIWGKLSAVLGPAGDALMIIIQIIGVFIIGFMLGIVSIVYAICMIVAAFVHAFTLGMVDLTGPIMDVFLPIIYGLSMSMGEIITMGTGGVVTRPTLALIGESGPEAVLPLNEEGQISGIGSGDEKLLWATEDNGEKLDMLINITKSQGRLR